MGVNFNSIGNYNTKLINNNYKKVDSKKEDTIAADKIDKNEKLFFANLYPDKRNEVLNYSFYERTGKMNGVTIGTNFDKRG